MGTGSGLSVSPMASTTYYGRYEDGAPCSYTTACASVTITVLTDPFQRWQLLYFWCTNSGSVCAQAVPDADPYGKGISNTNQFLSRAQSNKPHVGIHHRRGRAVGWDQHGHMEDVRWRR